MAAPPPHQFPDGPDLSVSARLREAADLLEVDPADCPDAVKRDRLRALCSASGRLDAALAREVSVFDANTVWAGDGVRSAAAWTASRTELSPAHARAMVRTAREVRAMPVVDAAWADGRIGTAKVTALVRARAAHPDLFATCEAALVDEIDPMTVTRAEAHIARWAAIAEATAKPKPPRTPATTPTP